MQDIIDYGDGFVPSQERYQSELSFTRLLFAMMLSLLVMYIPFLSECGSKKAEMQRDRRPFEEKVSAKLSKKLFRRIY